MSYESPISTITMEERTNRFRDEFDNMVFQTVVKTGVKVDKQELIKALQYDRNQYEKGYADGQRDAVRHGYWKSVTPAGTVWIVECSECKERVFATKGLDKYCKNCGAKMD